MVDKEIKVDKMNGIIDSTDLYKFRTVVSSEIRIQDIFLSFRRKTVVLTQDLVGINKYIDFESNENYKLSFNVNSSLSLPFHMYYMGKGASSFYICFGLWLANAIKKNIRNSGTITTINKTDSGLKLFVKKCLLFLEPKLKDCQPSEEMREFVLVESLASMRKFDFPKYLHIALLNTCNLKCVMCPYHSEALKKESHTNDYFKKEIYMKKETMYKILDEAGKYGSSITFGQYEEAMLCKELIDYISYAKDKGCQVSLTTNGTLLKEHKAKKLLDTGIDHISFSLDASSKESYKIIRGGNFDVPIKNLKYLTSVRNEGQYKTSLRACMVLQDGNFHEKEDFQELMNNIGIDMISFYNLSTFEDGVWLNKTLNFNIERQSPDRYACSQLWSQAMIYPDGNISLCCATSMYVSYRDDIPYLGNVNTATIYDTWHSERYKKIRREALKGTFTDNSICKDCQIWHNHMGKEFTDSKGHLVNMNPYETFVTYRKADKICS